MLSSRSKLETFFQRMLETIGLRLYHCSIFLCVTYQLKDQRKPTSALLAAQTIEKNNQRFTFRSVGRGCGRAGGGGGELEAVAHQHGRPDALGRSDLQQKEQVGQKGQHVLSHRTVAAKKKHQNFPLLDSVMSL